MTTKFIEQTLFLSGFWPTLATILPYRKQFKLAARLNLTMLETVIPATLLTFHYILQDL